MTSPFDPPSFILDCGREVYLTAFHVSWTYSGLLEGEPMDSLNDDIVAWTRGAAKRLWGERPTHLIPPVIDRTKPHAPRLPLVNISVDLTCLTPFFPDNSGSELVVIWFRPPIDGLAIDRVIFDGIRGLPWDDVAGDFENF